jgi:hypothetical protein
MNRGYEWSMSDAENKFLDMLAIYQQYQDRTHGGLFTGSPRYGVYRAEIPELDFVLERSYEYGEGWPQPFYYMVEIQTPSLLISSVIALDVSKWLYWEKIFAERKFKRITVEYAGDISIVDDVCFWLNLMMPVDFLQS